MIKPEKEFKISMKITMTVMLEEEEKNVEKSSFDHELQLRTIRFIFCCQTFFDSYEQ